MIGTLPSFWGRNRVRILFGDRTISSFRDFTLFRLAESGRYINLGTTASELARYFRVVSYNFISLTSHHIDWFGLPVLWGLCLLSFPPSS